MKRILTILPIFLSLALTGQPTDYVAYYPFNGNANDESGNGNDGTVNGAIPTTDQFGNADGAYSFDGSNDFIQGPNNDADLQISGDLTVSLWFNADDFPGLVTVISCGNSSSESSDENNLFNLNFLSGSDLGYRHEYSNGLNQDFTLSADIQTDRFYHITFVRNILSNTVLFYLDGVLSDTYNYTEDPTGGTEGDLYIGGVGSGGFDGRIDDIRIYDRVLSETEVQEIYELEATPDLNDGLAAYYLFNGDATDNSGNGNDGTQNGGVNFTVEDRFGNANSSASFDGIDDYILIPPDDLPVGSNPWTISGWLKPTNESSSEQIIIEWGDDATRNLVRYSVEQVNHTYGPSFYNDDHTSVDLPEGNWSSFAITYDGSTSVNHFIDGVLVDEITLGGVLNVTLGDYSEIMGSGGITINKFYEGLLDDIRIYNRALSSTEIQNLYNEEKADLSDGLVAYYPFNNNELDESGNGNDATNTGGTSTTDRLGNANAAFGLDGIDDFLTVVDNTSLDLTNFTLSGWMYLNQAVPDGQFYNLFFKGEAGDPANTNYAFSVNSDQNIGIFYEYGSGTNVSLQGSTTVSSQTWYHFSTTYDGVDLKIYVNGTEEATLAEANVPGTNDAALLMGTNQGGTSYVNGILDDLRVYNRALASTEIQNLYELERPLTLTDGLLVSYELDGDGTDASGNGRDGTVSGTAATTDRFINSSEALSFDGMDDGVNISDLGSQPSNITLTAWFNFPSGGGDATHQIFEIIGAGALAVFENQAQTVLNLNGNFIAPVTSVTPDIWHQITLTYDGSTMTSYLDGVAFDVTSNSDGITYSTTAMNIGNASQSSNFFQGSVDQVRVYDRALSSSEVSNLYESEKIIASINDASLSGQVLMENQSDNPSLWWSSQLLTTGSFTFDLNNDAVAYGDSDTDNILDLNGTAINIVSEDLYALSFSSSDFSYGVQVISSVGILGSARTGDASGWDAPDDDLTYLGNGIFEIKNYRLFDGEVKFRANDDWFVNWGDDEGDGTTDMGSPMNISITAGMYDITLDVINRTYVFTQLQPFITTWQTTTDNENINLPISLDGEVYNYTVDWGDGTLETGFTSDATHAYSTAGTYTVSITGTFPRIYFNNGEDGQSPGKILTVEQWGDIEWTSFQDAFHGCTNLTIPATDAPNLTGVTSLREAFRFCETMNNSLDHWDVSTITNMQLTFANCMAFNQDLNSWAMSNVTITNGMFTSATSFNGNITSWDVSKVEDFGNMFVNADAFNQNIGGWVTSAATAMNGMFLNNDGFNQDISGWDVSGVTNFFNMFNSTSTNVFNQSLASWDISSATNMTDMLSNSSLSKSNYDLTLEGWAFLESGETQIPTGITLGADGLAYCNGSDERETLGTTYSWTFVGDSENCTLEDGLVIYYPFSGTAVDESGNGLDPTTNDASLGTDRFGSANSAYVDDGTGTGISIVNDSEFDLGKFTYATWFKLSDAEGDYRMANFVGGPSMSFPIGSIDFFDASCTPENVQSGAGAFGTDWYHVAFVFDYQTGLEVYLDGVSINTQSLTGCSSPDATEFRIGFLDPNSSVLDGSFDEIRLYNRKLSDIEVQNLYDSEKPVENPFITTWQTTTDNENINIPVGLDGEVYDYTINWGDGTVETGLTSDATHAYSTAGTYTVSITGTFPRIYFNSGNEGQMIDKILTVEQWGDIQWTSMRNSFEGCSNLRINASDAPDLSNVTDMFRMFYGATSLNDPINHWDVSNVTILAAVFEGAASFNQPLNSWNTGNAENMLAMFNGANAFNQDLSSWDVSNVQTMEAMLNASSFDQSLAAWDISAVTNMTNMLSNSGLSKSNYDLTLEGWSFLGSGEMQIPTGLTLGADGLVYCNSADERETLSTTYSWTFVGDSQSCTLDDGLIIYYPFSGTAVDESGNGLDPTTNDGSLGTDRLGNANSAYSDDGAGTGISIVNENDFDLDKFTYTSWFKLDERLGDYALVFFVGGPDIRFQSGRLDFFEGTCSPDASTYGQDDFGTSWHHVALTYDYQAGVEVTLDGMSLGTQNLTGCVAIDVSELRIGYLDGANSSVLSGLFDEIRLYDRVLSSSEVDEIYQQEKPSITLNPRVNYSTNFDITTNNVTYEGSIDISSNVIQPEEIEFNGNGSKLYVLDGSPGQLDIKQFSLSTAFDIETATYDNVNVSLSSQMSNPQGLHFGMGGRRLFVVGVEDEEGSTPELAHQYSLTTPYDLSTIMYDGFFDFSNEQSNGQDIYLNISGTKMYITGVVDSEVNEYSLNNPFDITYGVNFQNTLSITTTGQPLGIDINANSKLLLLAEAQQISIYSFDNDLSSFDLKGQFDFSEHVTQGRGIEFSADGLRFYVTDVSGQSLHQFKLNSDIFSISESNSSLVDGLMVISLEDENFRFGGDGEFEEGTHFEIPNLPEGLIPSLNIGGDSTYAELTLSNPSGSIENLNSVTDLRFTFFDEAFSNFSASQVENATDFDTGIGFRASSLSSEALITSFTIPNQVGDEVIDNNLETISVIMPMDTDVTSLTPTIVTSAGASVDPQSAVAQNFTNPVTYTVTAEDGVTTKSYVVTVTIDDDLVAYYPFNGNANDESGNGLDGVVEGDAALTTDRLGNSELAYSFDGVDDRIVIANSPKPEMITVAGWFQTSRDYSGGYANIYDMGGAVGLGIGPTNELSTNIQIGEGNFVPVVASNTVNDGEWYHAVVTYDGSSIKLYLDGVMVAEETGQTGGIFYASGVFDTYLGYSFDGTDRWFDGGIDEIRIYDSALSDAEILAIYNSEKPVGNNSPVVANPITDVQYASGFENAQIDISEVFSDADDDALTYSASSNAESVVTVSVSNDILTITEVGSGSATITVTADDGNEGTVADMFEVVVGSNNSPVVANPITDVQYAFGFENAQIDISEVFSDADDDALTYSASSNAESVVTVSVNDNTLTITEVGSGSATVTVTADDGNGGTVADMFEVVVGSNNSPVVASEITDRQYSSGFVSAQIDISNVFSDADSDALTYSASSDAESVVTVSVNSDILTISEVGTGSATITVTADDGNGGIGTDRFEVVVLADGNNTPSDITLSNDEIAEVQPGGSTVGQFSTTDADEDDSHTYSLISGDGDTDNASFSLSSTGQLTTNSIFDFETKSSYSIRVQTDDSNENGTYAEIFIINVTNVNPRSSEFILENTSIIQGAPDQTVVGTFNVVGTEGPRSTYEYSLVGSSSEFSIDGSSLRISADVAANTYAITVLAEDSSGPDQVQNSFDVVVTSVNPTSSVSFGTTQANYRIIGLPTASARVSEVFTELNSGDQGTGWRIVSYGGSFSDLNTSSAMSGGVGYWFLSSESTTIDLSGIAPVQEDEIIVTLRPEWNLISNPFLESLNISQVIDYNVNQSIIQNGDVGSVFAYDENTVSNLEVLQGGWIRNNTTNSIQFRLPNSTSSASGRFVDKEPVDKSWVTSNENWQLVIFMEDGDRSSNLGAVGMRSYASKEYDQTDMIAPPVISEEAYFRISDENGLVRNFKPYATSHEWNLTINAPLHERVTLYWDNEILNNLDHKLYIHNPITKTSYSMSAINSIELLANSSFRILYGDAVEESTIQLPILVYPNPARDVVSVQFFPEGDDEEISAKLTIFGIDGRVVKEVEQSFAVNSLAAFRLDDLKLSSGTYLVQLSSNGRNSQLEKLILK